jgi:RNA polymerase sigma-70 factor (ECF subfamily)
VDVYNVDVLNDSGFDTPDGSIQIQEITGAINQLNEELKVPFSLYVSGYKYNEIADKLDMPLGTIKSRIFFARQELQKQLKDFH